MINYRDILIVAALLFACLFPNPIWALEEEISLDQALEKFYLNNYDILIHRYEIDKAQADLVGAKLLPNPNFTFNSQGLNEYARDNYQLVFRLDQLFELGGKREYRTKAAQETLDAAKLGHQDTIRTLLIGFYTLFYNLKLDALNKESAGDDLKRFDRILEIAEKRFKAGHLSLVDYTKIKVGRIELENNFWNFENQYKNDYEQFRLLIGSDRSPKPVLAIRENFPEYGEAVLIRKAQENRYDLLALMKQQKASAFNQNLAKAGKIPDVTIGAEYESFGVENRSGIGLGLSVPLPLFNRNQADIAHRKAEQKQLELQVEKLKKQIVVDIRQGLNNFSQSLKVLEAYKKSKSDMGELFERSEKAFALGGITVLDLLDTQKTCRDFMTKFNQALVQSNLNEKLIKVYSGEIK
jgi:cobalt-zinc-cadmium efflux system outer membrane protein